MKTLKSDYRLGKNVILNFIGLDDKDKDKVREMRNNPLIRRWMYSQKIISQKEHLHFISGLKNRNNDFYWLVKARDEYLGVISLNRLDWENRHAYLGIYTNPFPAMKGKGVQLMRCLKYVGFKKAGLRTIKLEVREDNRKAILFYGKNGFKTEGRLRQYVYSAEGWKDVLIMGIGKEQVCS